VYWVYRLLALGVLGYALVLGLLYFDQRRLLYHPDTNRPTLGDLAKLGVRDVTLRTADGLPLLSWYLRPPDGAPIVVYLHGNGGHIGYRADRVREFAGAGFGVLMVGYRGYGGNPGSASEAGLMTDARAALAFLDEQGVGPEWRVLYGESLGSGIAVQLAAHNPVAALILESPYTSISDVAQYHYPFVPARWMLHDQFNALAAIGAIGAPSLFLQAKDDRVVPPQFGRALYAAAPEPKRSWSTASGGHNDVGRYGGINAAIAFVKQQFAGSRANHAAD
jgi:uncharacterized protein